MRILVLGNGLKVGVEAEVDRMLPHLNSHSEVVAVDLQQKLSLAKYKADFALVFGGDGAILRAVHQMGSKQIPILGVNLGKLGFLADINPDQLPELLPSLASGNYTITDHLMFECEIKSKGQSNKWLGLNEIVVRANPSLHLIQMDLSIDSMSVARFSGDGLIISTPTGSTAHNLSAGGPVLTQELDAFVITPICAHTLTFRPIVDEASRTYSIKLNPSSPPAAVAIDGQQQIPISTEDEVVMRKADVKFRRIRVAGQNYYQNLRDKLHWGTPPRYRSGGSEIDA